MNRIFILQSRLLQKIAVLEQQPLTRDYPLDWERIHMASCAKLGILLAIKRHADIELAAAACAIHDFGRIITGCQTGHAPAGYEPLKMFFADNSDLPFSASEIEVLLNAAKNHSKKKDIGNPIEEIVKDADVLDCSQYGQELARPEQRARLIKVQQELGLIAQ